MIIYGWKSSHIRTTKQPHLTCPDCQEKGGIISSIYGRYVHIFWIPLIPLGKTGGTQCNACGKTFKAKEMPEDIKREYKEFKSNTAMPVWHLSGMVIIALIVGFAMISEKLEAQDELEYINNPLAGDVYEYEAGTNEFSTLKVIEVNEDSVFFVNNNYAFSTKSGIEKIDVDSCYDKDIYVMSKLELKGMFDDGTIFDINRK
ncbi:hypothetical protein E9993_16800 [Labilibacter sediminis]|nr:hypothetical protein E9993_16800 [Labilibacter sediminis]